MKDSALSLELCLNPRELPYIKSKKPVLFVIVDILRATSSICTALHNGAGAIIPVATLKKARQYKTESYLVAGERGGKKLDFADFGNSPLEFTSEKVKNKTIVFATTNGTVAMKLAARQGQVVLGSFGNLNALVSWLSGQKKNVVILCAGREMHFSLEDTVFAGALASELMSSGNFVSDDDGITAANELWSRNRSDLSSFLKKAGHYKLLESLGMHDSFEFILTCNTSKVIPLLEEDVITDVGKYHLK